MSFFLSVQCFAQPSSKPKSLGSRALKASAGPGDGFGRPKARLEDLQARAEPASLGFQVPVNAGYEGLRLLLASELELIIPPTEPRNHSAPQRDPFAAF